MKRMIADEAKLWADVRQRLSDFRFYHSRCVAAAAKQLAQTYGWDPEKAWLAGAVHDILKEQPRQEALAFFAENGVELTPLERLCPKLWHAMAGEIYLRKTYGLPQDMLLAVRYHTTGRENMTLPEQILFTADFISDDRDYNGVEDMRRRAKISLPHCMEEGLRFTIEELSRSCSPIHPDTLGAYNQILTEKGTNI